MLGGRRGAVPSGEIWQYGIDDGAWTRLFNGPSPAFVGTQGPTDLAHAAGVGDVLGASYDALRDVIVVIDEIAKVATERTNGPSAQKPASLERRLVVLDRRTSTARAIPLGKKALHLSRLGVVAREDGTFVVLAQKTNTKQWMAFRLALAPNGPSWTIIARGQGTLIDGAYATPRGVVVPVADANGLSFVRLAPDQCSGPAIDHDGDDPDHD